MTTGTYANSHDTYRLWVLSCSERQHTRERGCDAVTITPSNDMCCIKPMEIFDDALLECFMDTAVTTWTKKQVRLNTREFYSSTTCGLVLEELEGYSGLIGEFLSRNFTDERQMSCAAVTLYPFLGAFDFDPVKVYDLQLASEVETSYHSRTVDILTDIEACSRAQLAGLRSRRCFESDALRLKVFADNIGLFLISRRHVGLDQLLTYIYSGWEHGILSLSELDRLNHIRHSLSLVEGACIRAADESSVPILERFLRFGCVVNGNSEICDFLHRALTLSTTDTNGSMDKDMIMRVSFLTGPRLMSNVPFCSDLFKFLSHAVTEDVDKPLVATLLSICVLPGLSLVRPNPQLSLRVFNLIKMFNVSERMKIYKYATSSCTQSPSLSMLVGSAMHATQRILRRLSTENSKHLGRKLGKLMNRYPFTVVHVVLQQIQAYPNMIAVVVESLKYSSALSLDILVNTLILCMSSEKRKLKADGQHIELWFASLCSFTGALFKRFKLIDLRVVLLYILNSLKNGQILDLLILKELITQMTGIEVLRDISHSQILLLSAGSKLQMYHANKVIQKRNVNGAARLRRALKSTDSNKDIAITLLVIIYKCRNYIMVDKRGTQLKFVSQWYDECQNILLQYIDFLQFACSNEEYSTLIPSIRVLAHEYGLENSIIFHIHRPIARQIQRNHMVESSNIYQGLRTAWRILLEDVQNIFPRSVWETVSSEFCMEYWCMSASDIFAPTSLYDSTITKCKQDLSSSKLRLQHEVTLEMQRRIMDLSAIIDGLTAEYNALSSNISRNKERLTKTMLTWIGSSSRSSTALVFLQYFVFPRSKLSHTDAFYVSQFMNLMHTMHIPRFSTLQYHDVLFRDFAQLVFSCSESESTHFGIFMLETLRQLSQWRDPAIYAVVCAGFDGFSTCAATSISKQAQYSDFLKISYKWQHRLAKALLFHLSGSEYMELRNVLVILVTLVDQFPVIASHGRHLYKHVERIMVKDDRGDITTVAKRYLAMLKSVQFKWEAVEKFTSIDHVNEIYGI